MKNIGDVLGYILVFSIYAAISFAIMYLVSRSGIWPSGSDTMCHIYKGSVLYQAIRSGNWYPLFDPMWYNGVEMMRYWAPLPVYFLAMCQALAAGDCMGGYLIYLGIVFFLGAAAWFIIGCRHRRPVLGAFVGVLWFFMPNNLFAIFVEGNLPRALCMAVLPLFVENVHDYLLEKRWSSLPKITLCFVFMTLCHTGYAGMIALAMLIFLVVYGILYRKSARPILHVLLAVILGFLLTGIWLYASLQGGITSTDSSQVMRQFFQNAWTSLDPMRRLSRGFDVFYFGLAAFLLVIFGILFAKKRSMAGFWTAFVIFLCTTTTMYDVLVTLPGSQYLWMLRFISIALCFALYSLLIWSTLKKPFLIIVLLLLVLDTVPSLQLIYGAQDGVTPQQRLTRLEKDALIAEARSVTNQRLTLMDLSALEATGAYCVSDPEHDGVRATFGAGWQSAATAMNISRLNESFEKTNYLYLFDRMLELGSDTAVIRISSIAGQTDKLQKLDAAAGQVGYEQIDDNGDYVLYHIDTPQSFGVTSRYPAIGIGTSAPLMSMAFPSVEETTSTNLNDYTYEELSQYDTVYLAGFTYDDKESAEDMVRRLAENGTKVVILADGIPVDNSTGVQSFLGTDCHSITFKNGYPALDTMDGVLYPDLFPSGYTEWKTVYINGLDEVWGTSQDLDQSLDFYGTKYNDNLIFIGFNLTYHYALTQDPQVGALLSRALDLDADELPERTVVPLHVTYDSDRIVIESDEDDVNTTISYHDIFRADQPIGVKNHLVCVSKGTTVITMTYPYMKEGALISLIAAVLTAALWIITGRRARKDKNLKSQVQEDQQQTEKR